MSSPSVPQIHWWHGINNDVSIVLDRIYDGDLKNLKTDSPEEYRRLMGQISQRVDGKLDRTGIVSEDALFKILRNPDVEYVTELYRPIGDRGDVLNILDRLARLPEVAATRMTDVMELGPHATYVREGLNFSYDAQGNRGVRNRTADEVSMVESNPLNRFDSVLYRQKQSGRDRKRKEPMNSIVGIYDAVMIPGRVLRDSVPGAAGAALQAAYVGALALAAIWLLTLPLSGYPV